MLEAAIYGPLFRRPQREQHCTKSIIFMNALVLCFVIFYRLSPCHHLSCGYLSRMVLLPFVGHWPHFQFLDHLHSR
jgi:hypothetical protein